MVEVDHFDKYHESWYVKKDGIRFLAYAVFEKSDDSGKKSQGPVLYKVPFRDDIPELCFLRHLLIYVHCSKVFSDFLYVRHELPEGYDFRTM